MVTLCNMKRSLLPIAVLLLSAALLGACGGGFSSLLRDDYMGKSLLQPDNQYAPVKRDEKGNPVLD